MKLQEVQVQALTPERLSPLIGPERMERFHKFAQAARDVLSGRVVLNVNSTPSGGGVAEMLRTLLAYARGVGVDTQWVVINGDPSFFTITKRIHNNLYGALGDGGPLGRHERRHYEETLHANARELLTLIGPTRHRLAPRSSDGRPRRRFAEVGPPWCGAATWEPIT